MALLAAAGVSEVLRAFGMHDSSARTLLAGSYTSAGTAALVGAHKGALLAMATVGGASAVACRYVEQETIPKAKRAYLQSLRPEQQPSFADFAQWAIIPTSRPAFLHAALDKLDLLLFGQDWRTIRARLDSTTSKEKGEGEDSSPSR